MPKDIGSGVASKLVSGGIAGVISRTATAPMDRIKTLRQAAKGAPAKSLAAEMAAIYASSGLRGLFAGNGWRSGSS